MEIAVSVSGLVKEKKSDRADRAYFFFMQNGDLGGLHQASFPGEHEEQFLVSKESSFKSSIL